MFADRSATSPSGIRVKPIEWVIQIGPKVHRFKSLSQMDRWLNSDPAPLDGSTTVTLLRNGKRIYQGPWGEGIADPPTLW